MRKAFTLGTSLKTSVTLQSNSLIEYKKVLWKGIFLTAVHWEAFTWNPNKQQHSATLQVNIWLENYYSSKIFQFPIGLNSPVNSPWPIMSIKRISKERDAKPRIHPGRGSQFWIQLCKLWRIDPSVAKQPLKICKDTKFECYLLKTKI